MILITPPTLPVTTAVCSYDDDDDGVCISVVVKQAIMYTEKLVKIQLPGGLLEDVTDGELVVLVATNSEIVLMTISCILILSLGMVYLLFELLELVMSLLLVLVMSLLLVLVMSLLLVLVMSLLLVLVMLALITVLMLLTMLLHLVLKYTSSRTANMINFNKALFSPPCKT